MSSYELTLGEVKYCCNRGPTSRSISASRACASLGFWRLADRKVH